MAVVTTTLRATGNNTSLVRASNVVTATLTTASTPNIKVGDTVVIAGSTATTDSFNGTFTVTGVTSTTVYTYAQAGADETATAAGTSGGDYSLMSTWDSTEQTNLAADLDSHELYCYDDWPSGLANQCTLDGWVPSATYDLQIKAAVGHECYWDGSSIQGFYMTAAATTAVLTISDLYVTTTGIGVETSNYGAALHTAVGSGINIDRCIGRSTFTGNNSTRVFRIAGSGVDSVISNCLAISDGIWASATYNYGFYMGNNTSRSILNCTAISTTSATTFDGFEMDVGASGVGTTVKNCVAYSSAGTGFTGSVGSITASNNASNDTSAWGTSPVHSITSAAFADYASGDYQPASGGVLQAAGADLSGTFTTDVRGRTRSFWDIGAYKVDDYLWTLRDGTGDFSTMSTWESTNQRALSTLEETETLECYGDWASGLNNTAIISGWATDATYYITVKAAAGHEAWWDGSGIGGGFWMYAAASASFGTLHFSDAGGFLAVENIGLESTWDGAPIYVVNNNKATCYISGVICHNTNTASGNKRGFRFGSGLANGSYIINCLSVIEGDATGATFRYGFFTNVDPSAGAVDWYNNTAILKQGGIGFECASGTFTKNAFYNCVAYGGTGWGGAGTWAPVSADSNASSDTTAPGTSPVHSITSAAFVDYANGNYRPEVDGALWAAGTDLSGTFTTDVRGETRSFWGIGAYDSDGFYRTLRDGTGDYALMATAESDMQTDLTATGDRAYLECYDDWASGLNEFGVLWNGWTTDIDYYITIRAAAGSENNGVYDTGFRLKSTGGSPYYVMSVDVAFTCVQGIGVYNTNTWRALRMSDSVTSYLERCIFEANDTAWNQNACSLPGGGDTVNPGHLRNCIVINTVGTALHHYSPYRAGIVENCTIIALHGHSKGTGGATDLQQPWKNNLWYCTNLQDPLYASIAYEGTDTNNAFKSGIDTDFGLNKVTGVLSTDFVDYAGGNYRPNHLGVLHGAGTDLSGSFTTDIRGEIYYDWSIGAFDSRWATKTLRSAGGDYTLGSTWESTEQRALTEGVRLLCYNDWSGNGLVDNIYVSGWTGNNSINQIMIEPAVGEGHDGVIDAGFKITKGIDGVLDTSEVHTTFRNIQVNGAESNTSWKGIQVGTTSCTVDRCIVDCKGYTMTGLRTWGNAAGSKFTNNLVFNNTYRGMHHNADNGTFYNCTVIGTGAVGILTDYAQCTVSDCVAIGFTADYSNGAGALNFSGITNASGDSSAKGTSPVTGVVSGDFVDYANDDYRIDDTSALYGTGTDLTGTFTDDIRGTATRISTSPDIGAYKFDVVTKTLKASAGDYTLMSTWESTEQTDLVADGERHVLDCYAFACTDICNITGWTTDATSFITLKAAAGDEHNGVMETGFYLYTTANNTSWTIDADYTEVYDLGLRRIQNSGSNHGLYLSGTNILVDRFWGLSSNYSTTHGIIYSATTSNTVRNTISKRTGQTGRCFYGAGTFENCTAVYNAYGFRQALATMTCINCVSYDCSTADFNGTITQTYCASGDTTATGTGSITGVVAGDFVDYAGGDYQPTSTGALAGTGTDLSGSFTDDITGTTRVTWDIGAYIAAAGGGGWSITDIDLDNSIVNGQTGVIIAISGTVAASGKKVWLVQGANWVEQTVTAEDSSSATITVTYGGVLSAGAATLYVRNPL